MGGVINTKRVFRGNSSKIENQALAGFEFEVFGKVEIMVCQNLLNLGSVANDLGIARHIEGGGFAGAVEDGKDGSTLILTGDDIDTIIGDKLDLLTFRNHLISLTPMEQTTEPLEHTLL